MVRTPEQKLDLWLNNNTSDVDGQFVVIPHSEWNDKVFYFAGSLSAYYIAFKKDFPDINKIGELCSWQSQVIGRWGHKDLQVVHQIPSDVPMRKIVTHMHMYKVAKMCSLALEDPDKGQQRDDQAEKQSGQSDKNDDAQKDHEAT